jgi:hypothetical protein
LLDNAPLKCYNKTLTNIERLYNETKSKHPRYS